MSRPKTSGPAFSKERAEHAVRFINALTHTKDKWAGKPFALRPWQEDIVRRLFGTMRADDPTRRAYRTCYIEVPRKNGKSELAAAFALYGLIGEKLHGAEVYSAAADRDQASLVFNVAAQMVRNDPRLDAEQGGRLKIIDSQKRIVDHKTGSFYRAISAEAYSKHGFNASMVIYDELHAAPNRELWDVLATSMGARHEPLMIAITTAGFDRQSICWEQHEYAQRVLDGLDDATFLPVIYSAPDDADWTDEAVWRAANPALADFRDIEDMRMHARRAKEIPSYQNTFRRLYLNQWTEQNERFIDMHAWRKCKLAPPDEDLVGVACYGGLDLGQSDDFSAWVRIWPMDDGRVVVKCRFWVPESALEKYPSRRYDVWQRQGLLTVTEGPTTDYDTIEQAVMEDCLRDGVREVGYDNRFAEQMAQHLMGAGITMVNTPQGFQLNEAIKRKNELIAEGLLCHGDHEILTWMAGNYVVRHGTKGDVRPDKQKAGEKIDGQVALDMAIGRWIPQELDGPSVYEDRGVLVF
jgi:phage terminase large subunit-like protein